MLSKQYSEEEIRQLAFRRWGIQVRRAGRNGGDIEFCGPCPFCRAGTNRFRVWSHGNFWCRQCEEKGWLEENRKDWQPEPGLAEELQRLLEEKQHQRLARLASLQQRWTRDGFIEGWHARMQVENLEYWAKEGIPSWAINYYKLGYCSDKMFKGEDGAEYHSPAYTIPIYDPTTWQIVNIQYRLMEVLPEFGGKYRQEAGIPASAFYTRRGVLDGQAIVVEGAKKAIVVLECIGKACQVVGWPSITPSERLIREMAGFNGGLWLILDPGSNNWQATERAARVLHPVPVRWVEMPIKPDDAIVKYGMGKDELRGYLKQARRL